MDKLFNLVKFDKKYIFFSLIIVIFGIIFGSIYIVLINKTDRILVVEYIEKFMKNIGENSFNYTSTLINTLLINNCLIVIMIIFGISCILVPINILLLFYKSFIIGFSISGFILTFKIRGLLLSLIYVFPHLIFNIILLCILTAFTLKLSLNIVSNTIKRKKVNLATYFQKYLYVVIIFMLLISLSSLYETYVLPYLIKKAIILI